MLRRSTRSLSLLQGGPSLPREASDRQIVCLGVPGSGRRETDWDRWARDSVRGADPPDEALTKIRAVREVAAEGLGEGTR